MGSSLITDLICSFLAGVEVPIPTLMEVLEVSPNNITLLLLTIAEFPITTEFEIELSETPVPFPKIHCGCQFLEIDLHQFL